MTSQKCTVRSLTIDENGLSSEGNKYFSCQPFWKEVIPERVIEECEGRTLQLLALDFLWPR